MVSVMQHPTGFFKIILGTFMGRTIRLHVWPRGYQNVRADVHGHRCRVLSVPLLGCFHEARYREVDGDELGVIACAHNGRILEDGGRGSVELETTHERWPLVPNFMGLDVVHRFEPMTDRLHVTLVVFGRRRKERAKVFHA